VVFAHGLTSFSLPALRKVGGFLQLHGNEGLTTIDLPVLTSVGGDLLVVENSVLTTIEMPALKSVGAIYVDDNDSLTSFEFPALSSVNQELSALASADAKLEINRNDALVSLSFPALTSVGDAVRVLDNPSLAQCLVDALITQIEEGEGIGDSINTKTANNNPNCTCSEVGGVLKADCD
jgi:hypothetical protein